MPKAYGFKAMNTILDNYRLRGKFPRRFFRYAGCVLMLFVLTGGALAQDVVVTQGRTYQGRVLAADAAGVKIALAQGGEIAIPRASIVRLQVTPPPSVTRGIEAYEKGVLREAQINLEKVAFQFQGLDLDWAAKALLYYGRACLASGEYEKAEKALTDFMQAYAEHGMHTDAQIGLAEIKIAKQQYEFALVDLEELAGAYDAMLKPPKSQVGYAAAIYIGIGKCYEALDAPHEALQAYLRVVGLYAVEPFYSEALLRGARLMAADGRLDGAENMLTELLEEYKTSPFAGQALEERKNVIAQRKALEASLKK